MKKILTTLTCLSLFLLLLLTTASAVNITEQFEKELPIYKDELLPQAEFEEQTTLHDVVPFQDDELHYKIRLPKDWAESTNESLNNYVVSDKVLGEIARYYSPPELGLRSRFSVNVTEVKYEVSALHWFMKYVLDNAITLQGIREVSNERVEALYVQVIDDVSYVIRSVAQMTGNRVVLAEIYIPIQYWQKRRGLQNQIIDSFNLSLPKAVHIEDLKSMLFLDIAELKYPASWYLKEPNTRSVDLMSAKLVNLNEINVLNGRIDVALLSTYGERSMEEQYEWYKKELEKTGLKIQHLMDKADDQFIFHPDMDYAFVDVYKAQNVVPYVINYELWIAVMGGDGYFYFVTLLTPSRDEEFFVWARNVETMKIVVQNLGPQEILFR